MNTSFREGHGLDFNSIAQNPLLLFTPEFWHIPVIRKEQLVPVREVEHRIFVHQPRETDPIGPAQRPDTEGIR